MRDPQLPGFEKPRARKALGNRGAGLKWRCKTCAEIAKSWVGAQRHADENRHYRIEVVL